MGGRNGGRTGLTARSPNSQHPHRLDPAPPAVERGVSQARLAVDTGIDAAYVSALECEQGNATVDLLERIVGALDVDLGELFERPKPGAQRPQPLRPGRRPRAADARLQLMPDNVGGFAPGSRAKICFRGIKSD